jgi:hypothetical protein
MRFNAALLCMTRVQFRIKNIQLRLSLLTILILGTSAPANAALIDIAYFSSFLNSPDIGSLSIEDTQIGAGFNEFGGAGLETIFTNNLDAENLGTVTWTVTNHTGGDLSNASFFSFLDAEITEPGNSFFNEYGNLVDVSGGGAGDINADSWEIDEPGLVFGDIYDNILYNGALDNTNNVPSGLEDDVSLALGFDVGDFLDSQTLVATFTISDQNIGGLSQTDPDSMTTFYFNGTVELLPLSVPEPSSLVLFTLGLLSFGVRRIARQSIR